jgi:hypothetical protein
MKKKKFIFTLELEQDRYLDVMSTIEGLTRSQLVQILIMDDIERNHELIEKYKDLFK